MTEDYRPGSHIPIAFVITELAPGGAERCLAHLATHLDREAFEPAVYSIRPRPSGARDVLVRQLEAAGVPVRFADIASKWQAHRIVGRLKGLLGEQQPRIVQNFLYHANVAGTLAAKQVGVPHILMGMRVADPRRLRSWLERLMAKDAQRIVCVSQGVAEFCRQRGMPAGKLVVIPNGVDPRRFQDALPLDLAELGLSAGRKAIVFIGRLDRQKGLDEMLAHVAPILFERLPEHDLVLVGDGPARAALERLAGELQIAGRVHFAGWRADVPAILAAAELLVLPSRWEGMPNVVLEAMAAGKPVVAMAAEGVAELLGHEAGPQVVPIDDAQGFAASVIQLSQDPQLSAELGRQNQQRAGELFSLEAMVAEYERLYRSLVAG